MEGSAPCSGMLPMMGTCRAFAPCSGMLPMMGTRDLRTAQRFYESFHDDYETYEKVYLSAQRGSVDPKCVSMFVVHLT